MLPNIVVNVDACSYEDATSAADVFEMHSGFLAIRDELPQNIRARRKYDPAELSAGCLRQIRRG